MASWRIFQLVEPDSDAGEPTYLWAEYPALETEHLYIRPSAEELGEEYGAGTYLVWAVEGHSPPTSIKVVAEQRYYDAADVDFLSAPAPDIFVNAVDRDPGTGD